MSDPRPCSLTEAVGRARQALVLQAPERPSYQLGTGGYHPTVLANTPIDRPWTYGADGEYGCDCAGFAISWAYKLTRHRPGFNRWTPKHGEPGPSVVDDINVDSAIEDADHNRELFAPADGDPRPGDLLVYPTIAKIGDAGPWIGHVSIVVGVERVFYGVDRTKPATSYPRWGLLDVMQSHGPNGFRPSIVATDGSIWVHHDATWPAHRSRLLRVVP